MALVLTHFNWDRQYLEVESLKEELLSVKDQLREQSALVEKLKTELETLKNKRPSKKK